MLVAAAILYTALATVLILFQLALAVGAPWGKLTMGGFHTGTLPKKFRFAAILQALVILTTVAIVTIEAGLWLGHFKPITSIGIWFVIVLFSISLILNLITRSIWERRMGAPIALCMLICSIIIAVS